MDKPSFEFNPKEFVTSAEMIAMPLKEVGKMLKEAMKALLNGDDSLIKQVPGVVKVFKGTAKRPSIPPSVRKRVLSVGSCVFCGSTENLTVDHIIPFSKGGAHDESNFQCLCWPCNLNKSDKIIE